MTINDHKKENKLSMKKFFDKSYSKIDGEASNSATETPSSLKAFRGFRDEGKSLISSTERIGYGTMMTEPVDLVRVPKSMNLSVKK